MNDKPEWKNLPRWCRHVSNKWTTLSNEPLYTMSHGNVVMEFEGYAPIHIFLPPFGRLAPQIGHTLHLFSITTFPLLIVYTGSFDHVVHLLLTCLHHRGRFFHSGLSFIFSLLSDAALFLRTNQQIQFQSRCGDDCYKISPEHPESEIISMASTSILRHTQLQAVHLIRNEM